MDVSEIVKVPASTIAPFSGEVMVTSCSSESSELRVVVSDSAGTPG